MTTKNPSFSTISTLLNSMIGGTMLTLPILFRQSGIMTGILILLISGLISYKTCSLYVLHIGPKQNTIEETIHRISGKKWQKFFKGLTGYYLICLSVIYMDIIEDQLYGILYYILDKTDHQDWIAVKGIKNLVFDRFSMQYMSIICLLPLLGIISIRNLAILIRMTALGVLSVVIYMLFILYQFFDGISDIDTDKIPFFKTDIGNLAGTCAIAFTIHTVINPIMKSNQNQQNNLRDLRISYILGFLIYTAIGCLGCISILDKQCQITIVNCYLSSWQALLVQSSYLIGLITVFPCFFEIARTRLLQFHFGAVTDKHCRMVNIGFIILASVIIFFSPYLPLDLIMNLVGSLLCFFFVYLIPTKFHFDCLYSKARTPDSLITEQQQNNSDQNINTENTSNNNKCSHSTEYANKVNKTLRIIIYGFINLIGIAVGIYGIYQFFSRIINLNQQ